MFSLYRTTETTYVIQDSKWGLDLLVGLTLEEALLIVRSLNGAKLKNQEQDAVDDLILNREAPFEKNRL